MEMIGWITAIIAMIAILLSIILSCAFSSQQQEQEEEKSDDFHTQYWERHISSKDIYTFCERHNLPRKDFLQELKKQEYFFIDDDDYIDERIIFSYCYGKSSIRIGYIGTKEGHELCHHEEQQQLIKELKEKENKIKKYL